MFMPACADGTPSLSKVGLNLFGRSIAKFYALSLSKLVDHFVYLKNKAEKFMNKLKSILVCQIKITKCTNLGFIIKSKVENVTKLV